MSSADIYIPPIPMEVTMLIVEQSDWWTLLRWRRVCKRLYRVVRHLVDNRFRAVVEPFFPDLDAFSNLLRKHGAIISGSVALRFFLPNEDWDSTDIDVYVPDDQFVAFREALQMTVAPGSMVLLDSAGIRPPHLADEATYDFKQLVRLVLPSGKRMDIIRSFNRSATSPLHTFWSTLVFNYITPDVYACGYPDYTLNRIAILKAEPFSASDARALDKYVRRGFEVSEDIIWGVGDPYEGEDTIHFLEASDDLDGDESGMMAFSLDPLSALEPSRAERVVRSSCGWCIVQA